MAVYATVEQLQARWRTLSDDESARAAILLEDASAYLAVLVEKYGIYEKGKAKALEIVCCNLVERKMTTQDGGQLSSVTQSAGPYSVTMGYRQSTKWELEESERELLGISRKGRAKQIPVAVHDGHGGVIWP